MPRRLPAVLGALALGLGLSAAGWADGPPRVVASLLPVHALVASVTGEITRPELLFSAGGSPHQAALRPSQARALERAALIVWVGPVLEPGLARALARPRSGQVVLRLDSVPGMRLWPLRDAGLFAGPGGGAGGGHDHGQSHDHGHADTDPHLWLDPDNARTILAAVAAALAGVDPDNAGRYRANAAAAADRVRALDAELSIVLAPVRTVPYVVFHDAYQGFERHYGLNAVGAVSLSPERPPGARRLRALRRALAEAGVRCVFREPQFPPRLVETLVAGTAARTGELDPLGAGLVPGPDAWFALMRGLAADLAGCLGEES